MTDSRKPSLAARIFPPPVPPRTHSLPAQYQASYPTVPASTHPVTIQHQPIFSSPAAKADPTTIQQPVAAAAAAPSHRRSITCHAPIIFYDREEKSRREQTAESEEAREEILKHGIKVRDFQVEMDEKRLGGGSGRGVHRLGDQERRS
ncbi:hypothetical protein H2200_003140 [Cladophialophora chaetospira]|uniref:Uncharacterized protein n=1 Tax=Cladophialophora chaetospira TaxID=386627 RepID=A0AA38XGV9_9EURO|nr:hypothetical protein H2200_003140 [Cladophialophora chaetospira]